MLAITLFFTVRCEKSEIPALIGQSGALSSVATDHGKDGQEY